MSSTALGGPPKRHTTTLDPAAFLIGHAKLRAVSCSQRAIFSDPLCEANSV